MKDGISRDLLTASSVKPMVRVTTGVLYVRRAEIFRRAGMTLRT